MPFLARPVGVWAVAVATTTGLVWARLGRIDLVAAVAMAASMAALLAVVYGYAALVAGRYLRGLSDGGATFDVIDDRFGWFGDRHLRLRTSRGEWEVEATGGKNPALYVRRSGSKRRERIIGNQRRAGREAAQALLLGAALPKAEPEHARRAIEVRRGPDEARYRPVLGTVLALAGVGLALGAAWALARPAPPAPRRLLWVLLWTGLGFAAFLFVLAGSVIAWVRWERRHETLHRKWASAVLLTGLGTGEVGTALVWVGVAFLLGRPPERPLLAAVIGLAPILLALLALAWDGAPARLLLTLGVAAAVGAALFLPAPFLAAVAIGLALLSLFQAWTAAPPTSSETTD